MKPPHLDPARSCVSRNMRSATSSPALILYPPTGLIPHLLASSQPTRITFNIIPSPDPTGSVLTCRSERHRPKSVSTTVVHNCTHYRYCHQLLNQVNHQMYPWQVLCKVCPKYTLQALQSEDWVKLCSPPLKALITSSSESISNTRQESSPSIPHIHMQAKYSISGI